MGDVNLAAAADQIRQCLASQNSRPVVKSFFDEATFTATHVAHDPITLKGVIIDSVLDFDSASGRTSKKSADVVISYVREKI